MCVPLNYNNLSTITRINSGYITVVTMACHFCNQSHEVKRNIHCLSVHIISTLTNVSIYALKTLVAFQISENTCVRLKTL